MQKGSVFLVAIAMVSAGWSPALADPSLEEHFRALGQFLSDGQYDRALQLQSHFEDVHGKDSKNGRHALATQRCAIHAEAGQLSEAEEACGKAIRIVEDEVSKDIDDRDYKKDWRRYYENRAWTAYLARAEIRVGMEHPDEAEADELRALDLFDDTSSAVNAIGYSWADRGVNLPCAVDVLEGVVKKEPENPAYLDSLGWAY